MKKIAMVFSIVWLLLQIFIAMPDKITNDWMGWRQSDTQTIARNFVKSGQNILYPQINWGGAGTGYVECEFQLYTFAIAQILKNTGEAVWPGQALSLLAILAASWVIYLLLKHHFENQFAALFGALAFLTSNGAVHLSSSVMPDSLCILFYTLGLYAFFKYVSEKRNIWLVLCVAFSTLAGLVKPLALNIGIIQFLVLAAGHRGLLKSWKIWVSWLIIVTVVGLYMAFSYTLYLNYGNTFGVIGGESKFPSLQGLLYFMHYPKLAYMTAVWGLGPFGVISVLYLIIQKRFTYLEWVFLVGNAIVILISMRYTVNRGFGPHYYIFSVVFAAWLTASAVEHFSKKIGKHRLGTVFPLLSMLALALSYSMHLYAKVNPGTFHYHVEVTELGNKLARLKKQNSLAIVRSVAAERERRSWGNRVNNYEDPRVFYLADISGWPLPADARGIARIKEYVSQGADYFVELYEGKEDEPLYRWLKRNAIELYTSDAGAIYEFTRNKRCTSTLNTESRTKRWN
ncbi:MAG: phospholipid carrier-dependent glycosyltransferase [Chitinivibrionales bacterium]|nr:phospholipid carrier-dependent glycosyltransferase [Chitinivibrionales bacterium]